MFRMVQPYGRDRTSEATEIFSCATIAEAYEKIDRYAAHGKVRNAG